LFLRKIKKNASREQQVTWLTAITVESGKAWQAVEAGDIH